MTNLSDAELSLLIAKQAGTLLLELRESYGPLDAGDKEQADALRKQGDRTRSRPMPCASKVIASHTNSSLTPWDSTDRRMHC